MKTLALNPISDVLNLAHPNEATGLTMSSPANLFFTDFTQVEPLVIDISVSALEVKRLMQKAHVRLFLVLDDQERFAGVISADDLIDRKIVRMVSRGEAREQIALKDLITPKSELKALDFNDVGHASVGDIVATLKDSGSQHCLVVEQDTNRIRGIFSASDISRKLHLPIDIQEQSSFLRVFKALG